MYGWKSTLRAAWYVRHARWACLCYVPTEIRMVFVNYIYDLVVDTQFHKLYGRPFACVLYLFLMRYIGRWLPWVFPWFYIIYRYSVYRSGPLERNSNLGLLIVLIPYRASQFQSNLLWSVSYCLGWKKKAVSRVEFPTSLAFDMPFGLSSYTMLV